MEDNISAFPFKEQDGSGGFYQHIGMTLRDYFAGQALIGLSSIYSERPIEARVKIAWQYADVMIELRNKKKL